MIVHIKQATIVATMNYGQQHYTSIQGGPFKVKARMQERLGMSYSR